jgi:hypothetical protein
VLIVYMNAHGSRHSLAGGEKLIKHLIAKEDGSVNRSEAITCHSVVYDYGLPRAI